MTTKHTLKLTRPLPETIFIEDECGSVICQFPDYAINRDTWAEKIIRCVNSHDDLLMAASLLMSRLSEFGYIDRIRDEAPIQDLKEALAKAGTT